MSKRLGFRSRFTFLIEIIGFLMGLWGMGGEGNMDFALTFLDFSVISFRFLGELF